MRNTQSTFKIVPVLEQMHSVTFDPWRERSLFHRCLHSNIFPSLPHTLSPPRRDCLHLFYPAAFSSLRLSSPLSFSRPLILEVKYSIHCLSVCGFVLGALWPGETISLSNTRYQKGEDSFQRRDHQSDALAASDNQLSPSSERRHTPVMLQTPLTPDWSVSSSTWADSATQMLSVQSWSPFFQLTLPSSSPLVRPFLSHTALSSPYLSFPLLPLCVIFHVTALLPPTWDPSQGFLWLCLPQRPKQRDRGEWERKGERNPFFLGVQMVWLKWVLLPLTSQWWRGDERWMRGRWKRWRRAGRWQKELWLWPSADGGWKWLFVRGCVLMRWGSDLIGETYVHTIGYTG